MSVTASSPSRAGACEESVKCLLDHVNNALPQGGLCGACSSTQALIDAIKGAVDDPDISSICGASLNVAAVVLAVKDGFDPAAFATSLICAFDPNAGDFSSELNELNSWCRKQCESQHVNDLGRLIPCINKCDGKLGPDLICNGMTQAGAELICTKIEELDDTTWEEQCDCDFSAGGCSISTSAPLGKACDCSYSGGWTCSGDVVACPAGATDGQCHGKDLQACLQGGGDCGGYDTDDNCDCDYHDKSFLSGGCKISDAAPKRAACKCDYAGAWTCTGRPVQCKDEDAFRCLYPTKNKASCEQGGGDCDGY